MISIHANIRFVVILTVGDCSYLRLLILLTIVFIYVGLKRVYSCDFRQHYFEHGEDDYC